MRPIKNRSLFT